MLAAGAARAETASVEGGPSVLAGSAGLLAVQGGGAKAGGQAGARVRVGADILGRAAAAYAVHGFLRADLRAQAGAAAQRSATLDLTA